MKQPEQKNLIEASKHFNEGTRLTKEGKFAEAIEFYQKAMDFGMDSSDLWNNKGYTYKCLGQLQDALICYEKADQLKPFCVEILYNIADIYQSSKLPSMAIMYYKKVININNNIALAWYNLAISHRDSGPEHYNDAIQCLQIAGNKCYELKQPQQAILCYNQAINIDPTNAMTWNRFGILYDKLGDEQKADECYHKADIYKTYLDSLDERPERKKQAEVPHNPSNEQQKRKQEISLHDFNELSKRMKVEEKTTSDNLFKVPLPVPQPQLELSNPNLPSKNPEKIPQQQVQQQTLINKAVGSLEIFFKDSQKNPLFKDVMLGFLMALAKGTFGTFQQEVKDMLERGRKCGLIDHKSIVSVNDMLCKPKENSLVQALVKSAGNSDPYCFTNRILLQRKANGYIDHTRNQHQL